MSKVEIRKTKYEVEGTRFEVRTTRNETENEISTGVYAEHSRSTGIK